MEAVGGEVFAVLVLPVFGIVFLVGYYWTKIIGFIRRQLSDDVRMQQNQEERQRRQRWIENNICSICLAQPKVLEVSATCSHSFCAECILVLYRDDDVMIKCPLCRENIHLLFKLFASSNASKEIQEKMRQYNLRFDDDRPFLRRIQQFPYVLKRLWRHFFQLHFLAFFLRSLQVFRFLFIVLFYVIVPFDILPERVLGLVGFIDDLFFIVIVLVFLMTLAAIRYYRHHEA